MEKERTRKRNSSGVAKTQPQNGLNFGAAKNAFPKSMKDGNWNLNLAAAKKIQNWLKITENNTIVTVTSTMIIDPDPCCNATKNMKKRTGTRSKRGDSLLFKYGNT